MSNLNNIRKFLAFAAVALVSFSSAYIEWINSNQAVEYVSLTLYKPFVYRQLMPMLARSLTWYGVPANWAVVLVMTAAGIGFYYAFRALILHFYTYANELLIVGLWAVGLSLFWLERLPSDYATAALFSLALLFLAQDKLLAYCLLFPIVCLNRETACLLTIFSYIWMLQSELASPFRQWEFYVYQVFIWFWVRIELQYIFRNNGGLNAWIMPLHNFQVFFTHPWHSLLHIVIAGVILWLVFKGWNSKPLFLRTAFVIFAPLLLVMYWVFGQPYEVRVFWEVYPVTALLILPALIYKQWSFKYKFTYNDWRGSV